MIRVATTPEDYNAALSLFRAYASWLSIDLCFQNFNEELNLLPVMYGPPHGSLFLFQKDEQDVGCVAVRKIDDEVAELKRMYVLETSRNQGIAKQLLNSAIEFSSNAGYKYLRLDTLSTMIPAMNLYEKNGFKKIEAYYHNPIETAVYFELKLQ
jgi:ribosomal protein S18 acetylase RimI-like enzyme